jgi:serine/arginine repetitive matrix protein 1
LQKVALDTLEPWVEQRCTKLMGNGDEIVISYVMSHL